jgi:transposase
MYIRTVKTKNSSNNSEYINYKLVQSIRINGEPRQKILLSLGNLSNLVRYNFSKQSINKIEKKIINKEVIDKLKVLNDKKFYDVFHLSHALNQTIGKEYQEKYLSVITNHTNVFEINCKLLATRIEELYTNQKSCFAYEQELEELAQFYHRKLVEKNFKDDKLVKSPTSQNDTDYQEVDLFSFNSASSLQIGGEYLCSQAIEELQIPQFLSQHIGFNQSQVTNSILALIGRLLNPCSENETACWLNENSGTYEFYTPKSRRTNKDYLYQASLNLYRCKDLLLSHINTKVDDLFNLKSKIILYDLTNTHFEGQINKCEKAKYGKNKQKRSDCKQITLAMITDEYGFCKHSRYYPGNIGETTTLEDILSDISKLDKNILKGKKPCIIMDAGIASEDNLQLTLREGFDYIAVSRSQHTELKDKVTEDNLVSFKNKSGEELSAQLFSQSLEYQDKESQKQTISESIVYIKSPQKEIKEKSMDQKKCQRFEEGLNSIQKTVNNPRGQKSIEKIHQRLGRLKERNRGVTGYFNMEIKDDGKIVTSFEWKKVSNTAKEKKLGIYFIRTSIDEKQEDKIWHLYRTINEVEETFKELKSDLDMRPNYHQNEENIEAHINLCILSYQIVNFIRHRLKLNGIRYGWKKIRRIMSTQKCNLTAINKRDGRTVWIKSCTRPTANVTEIFQKMGYKTIPYYRKNITI